ncbi:hypothetical protein [Polaribacter uvawellassae]|uniref:hypothetical protein n=1 Tax=Polaribacter uvawellassae TaxID=3133495 RepID=UPI00321A70C3
MKKLKESDLQIGDILIFEDFHFNPLTFLEKCRDGKKEAFYYLLHYLIAWFDPGKEGENYRNIYHAGIWGNVDIHLHNKEAHSSFQDCVVQAGGNGIGIATLNDTLAHEAVMNVYVCRLKNRPVNFHQEINQSIRNFYKTKGHYSFETAWLLAAICSLRYTKGTLHKLIADYFGNDQANYIVEQILYHINEFNNLNQKDMVACSPLVAMMYKNAGYELAVNVFEVFKNDELTLPNFSLNELHKNFITNMSSISENWPPIKETVVTPRQLLESPDVELIGYLPHTK